jgi:hypothetical protein
MESTVVRSRSLNLLLVTGFGGVLFFVSFTVLGLLAPHYNSARDTLVHLSSQRLVPSSESTFSYSECCFAHLRPVFA